jgi:hypothetical protein
LSKLLTILTLILFGCTADKYEIFKITPNDKASFLDLNEINDIRTFNRKFWKADSADNDFYFIVKFDFVTGEFSNKSDRGISLEGLPYECLSLDCHRNYGLKLYLTDNYNVLLDDIDSLTEFQIKEQVVKNITNNGKDPSLSDNPQEAVTEIYLNEGHKIKEIENLIKIITDSYIELIKIKQKESNKPTDELTLEFPLKIHLRRNMIPTDLPKVIELEGDDWDVKDFEIDSTLFK